MTPRKKRPDSVTRGKATAKTKKAEQEKPALTREKILKAAMAIIEREGYGDFSMRKLGKELGVNPMSTYYHFPNKTALTDALVELVMSSIDLALDDPALPVEDRLLNAANLYREALLKYPSLIPAVASRAPRRPDSLRPVDVLVGIFIDAGLKPKDAFSSMSTLATYVRGSAMREAGSQAEPSAEAEEHYYAQVAPVLTPEEFPNLVKVDTRSDYLALEAIFDRGVRALIRGLLETYGSKEEEE
jgi:TetR/AcrR family tetracycline transcriptional repressor